MKTVGLVTEYNPFHNGHLHHLRESLRLAEADVSVAVMSGHFLQRGEPALVDKWVRAEMALSAGVDVVIELPLPWAAASAPDFAMGAVQALNALGGVDSLCFGSETGNLEPLQACARVLLQQEDEIVTRTSRLLRQGLNYPQARARVLEKLFPERTDNKVLSAPNNVLGCEYLKALAATGSDLEPLTIQRVGAGYQDTCVGAGQIASATGIRHRLERAENIEGLLPSEPFGILRTALEERRFLTKDSYFPLILSKIFSDSGCLDQYWLVEDGVENRLLSVADTAETLDELITGVKTRQLTRTRIQRMLVAILLSMGKKTIPGLLAVGPRYLHLLAVSRKGQSFLARRRQQRTLPLVQNFSRVYALLKRHYDASSPGYHQAIQQLNLELRATRVYTLLQHEKPGGNRNRDFYQPLIRGKAIEEGH